MATKRRMTTFDNSLDSSLQTKIAFYEDEIEKYKGRTDQYGMLQLDMAIIRLRASLIIKDGLITVKN
jgi:hypothetical protein